LGAQESDDISSKTNKFSFPFWAKKPSIYHEIDKKFAESLSISYAKSCLGCSAMMLQPKTEN
jgi:hypothetical protein